MENNGQTLTSAATHLDLLLAHVLGQGTLIPSRLEGGGNRNVRSIPGEKLHSTLLYASRWGFISVRKLILLLDDFCGIVAADAKVAAGGFAADGCSLVAGTTSRLVGGRNNGNNGFLSTVAGAERKLGRTHK